jgi:signal transduction histidine kinase
VTRPPRLGVRTRLLLAAVGAVALALVIGVVAFNLFLGQRLSASATSLARAQAAAELSSLEVVDGKLSSPTGLEEGAGVGSPVWVFSGTTVLERPRVPASLTAAASALAGGPERSTRYDESLRFYALPVTNHGDRIGTVVAGVALAPYNETATIALIGSIGLAVILLAAVALLSHWILGKALLPVSQMTEDAADWSAHDLDRRFNRGEAYDELTRLAATLDALLERLSASLRHEQRFTAELSHELRTPLARIAAESELALRRERSGEDYRASLEAVHRHAEQMTRTVEALVAAARQEAGLSLATSDARDGVRAAVEAVRSQAEAARIEMQVVVPSSAVQVAIEPDLVERIVHPLLDNAFRYGRSLVAVELSVNGTSAFVTVTDDGSGLAADETDSIFEPGVRGSAAADESRGAGLGLALARRLARSAGGEISAAADGAGARFSVMLPLA